MIKILKKEYWSKSKAFLLPLTGLSRTHKYPVESYLFWEDYSIENYYLIVKFTYDNYADFLAYARRVIIPVLDKNGYISESFDFSNETVFILNMSEWSLDIEMFLKGKYSKLSTEAKNMIIEHHTFYDGGSKIAMEIAIALNPHGSDKTREVLGKMSPMEYIAKHYELNVEDLKKIGELADIYNKENETLELKIPENSGKIV